jgi:serine/threonine-protein kinase
LDSFDLSFPSGIAVYSAGNVYFADSGHYVIKEWFAENPGVVTLVSLPQYTDPTGLALDCAGNIYINDAIGLIREWTPANNSLTTLVNLVESFPSQVAVDGSGNLYFPSTVLDVATNVSWINKLTVAGNTLTRLMPTGLNVPLGVAVDSARNLYVADANNDDVLELPYAFVDPTPKLEGLAAGSDSLPPVLPTTENLLPPFAPTSDSLWLTITGITNDVISFSFAENTGAARTANITLLGQTIPITQGTIGTPPTLTAAQVLTNGVLQFSFTNSESASFTVLSSTNLSLPLSNWTVVGAASNIGSGQFQFTSQPITNAPKLFYTVRSP